MSRGSADFYEYGHKTVEDKGLPILSKIEVSWTFKASSPGNHRKNKIGAWQVAIDANAV